MGLEITIKQLTLRKDKEHEKVTINEQKEA